MALSNFPQTPADGDTYTNPDNGQEYVYDATDDSWSLSSAAGASSGGGAPTYVTTAAQSINGEATALFTATSTGATSWHLVAFHGGTQRTDSVFVFGSATGPTGTGDTASAILRNNETGQTNTDIRCTFAFYAQEK